MGPRSPILVAALGASLAALVLGGCAHESTAPYVECPATGDCAVPWVTVVNGQSSAVTVDLNGTATGVTIAAGTSAQVSTGIGTSTLAVHQVGGSGSATVSVTLDGAASRATAIAYTDHANAFSASVLTDSGATPVVGASKLRVIHLAQAAGQLDIFRTQPDFQTPVALLFPFTYGSNNGFYQSTPGTWQVRAWKSTPGMNYDATGWNRALASLSVEIPSGGVRTIVVLDAPGNSVKLQLVSP